MKLFLNFSLFSCAAIGLASVFYFPMYTYIPMYLWRPSTVTDLTSLLVLSSVNKQKFHIR